MNTTWISRCKWHWSKIHLIKEMHKLIYYRYCQRKGVSINLIDKGSLLQHYESTLDFTAFTVLRSFNPVLSRSSAIRIWKITPIQKGGKIRPRQKRKQEDLRFRNKTQISEHKRESQHDQTQPPAWCSFNGSH